MISFTFSTALGSQQLAEIFYDPLIQLEDGVFEPKPKNKDLPIRILVVEDDPVAVLLTMVLKLYGECVVAKDGQTALELLESAVSQRRPHHLVVSDLDIPNIQG